MGGQSEVSEANAGPVDALPFAGCLVVTDMVNLEALNTAHHDRVHDAVGVADFAVPVDVSIARRATGTDPQVTGFTLTEGDLRDHARWQEFTVSAGCEIHYHRSFYERNEGGAAR